MVESPAQVLGVGVGWAVVVGLGFAFAAFMMLITYVQNRFTDHSSKSLEEFNSASRSVKPGLVAAGIVSAWTWAATLLQSTVMTYTYGKVTVQTTNEQYPTLAGNLVSICVSTIITVVWSLIWPQNYTFADTRAYNAPEDALLTVEETIEADEKPAVTTSNLESPEKAYSAPPTYYRDPGEDNIEYVRAAGLDPAEVNATGKRVIAIAISVSLILVIVVPAIATSAKVWKPAGLGAWVWLGFVWLLWTMTSLFGFSAPVDIDVRLEDEHERKQIDVKLDNPAKETLPVYFDGENVQGTVAHEELFFDRGNHYEFLSLIQELASPGEVRNMETIPFEFKNVEKVYESYSGINVKLRYFLRVTINRRMSDVVKEREIWVHSFRLPPDSNNAIKMEVGIEDCLHIEFEYNKSKYHLKDVIVGKIYFLLVRIKIKHMELSIIRRETTGTVPNQYNESETITKFEIMDGAPVRGETIPIRLFLGGFDLTPTFRDINKKFSTRYYLNLVLIDEENRRYFKQQEITFFRIPEN
ncbi:Vacuolar protein sorting-associated protein 26 [Malassezia obtusa]|uniref:Vacuolar protein sorting-associated protein 26 n=1 Tax=Malassezia obtusa TaxID=76774 RepID=A0AAF0ITG6_9BASI|nr:Vacuolar protein sorting-associated protein 26 [Malassezia obtusa]